MIMHKIVVSASAMLLALAATTISAGCLEDELAKAKDVQSFEKVGEKARSKSCGECCLTPHPIGCKQAPKDSKTVVYRAPEGYKVVEYTEHQIEGNGKGGNNGIQTIVANGDIVGVSMSYWCQSEHKGFGAGAWRNYKLTGKIEKILSEGDFLNIMRKCSGS
jgi:hypothetical protein